MLRDHTADGVTSTRSRRRPCAVHISFAPNHARVCTPDLQERCDQQQRIIVTDISTETPPAHIAMTVVDDLHVLGKSGVLASVTSFVQGNNRVYTFSTQYHESFAVYLHADGVDPKYLELQELR